MIFGRINKTGKNHSQIASEASNLKHLEFSENIIETTDFQSGQLTFLHHPSLPSSKRDHYFQDNELLVILSGQIYNESDLTQKTASPSNSQAELIALLYKQFGIEFINEINGDHAIVIVDHTNLKSFFVKSQLGTVPISVAQKDEFIYFSSDTMGLSKTLFGDQKIDDTYLKSRFFDYERNYHYTPNSSVRKVLPGHYIVVEGNNLQEIKYWPVTPIHEISPSFEEATTELDKLLLNAIKIRCNQEYTAGSHISGGLDSSLIAHLARKEYNQQDKFIGFTWSPKEYSDTKNLAFDERENIAKQAEFSDLSIEYTDITTEDYHDFVKEWRCQMEYITEKTIFEKAKANGVNLIFSGWGGDELIGVRDEGLYYESFMKFHWKDFFRLNRKKGLKSKMMHVVNNVITPTRRKIYFTLKISPDVFKFFRNSNLNNKNKDFSKDWYKTKTGYQLSLIEYYHLSQRCEDRYVHGQRNGIEYRYPLLDKNLAEYCLKLPLELFVGDELDRPLIRELCKNNLVDEIRLLMKMSDPVVMANSLKVQNEAVKVYITELNQFKNNEYLSFIDFDLVEQEIEKSKHKPKELNKKLNYLIHQIKSAHEFTIHYSDK